MRERRRLHVRGTVQGVGFRPFVYRQAVALGLAGWVGNDGTGVVLEVEGSPDRLDALHRALLEASPPLALVEAVQTETVGPHGAVGFVIADSRA